MSREKVRTAERLILTSGPFDVDELADPHNGTPVAELDPARARTVVEWYRRILSDAEPRAARELYAERLALLDGWLSGRRDSSSAGGWDTVER
jgi:hypothetical protein